MTHPAPSGSCWWCSRELVTQSRALGTCSGDVYVHAEPCAREMLELREAHPIDSSGHERSSALKSRPGGDVLETVGAILPLISQASGG